jgi:hypothetical protein
LGSTVALELAEDLVVALADDVARHVEDGPGGPSDARTPSSASAGRRSARSRIGIADSGALQTEALGADVLGGEELLERLGRVAGRSTGWALGSSVDTWS